MRGPSFHPALFLLLAVFIAPALFHPPASADEPETTVDEIVVGVPLALSGPNMIIGRMARDAYVLGMEEVNHRGGINGTNLRLDIRDTRGRTDLARDIIMHFIKEKQYPAAMGGLTSGVAREVASKCERYGVPYLSANGAADTITRRGYRYVFRLNPTFSMYASAITGFLREDMQPARIALIGERTGYSTVVSDALASAGETEGWEVGRFIYGAGAGIPPAYLDRLEAFGPDAVVTFTYPKETAFIMEKLREGLPGSRAIMDGMPSPWGPSPASAMEGRQDAPLALTIWSPRLQYAGAGSFFRKYRVRFGVEPDYHAAEAYSAVQVMAAALSSAVSISPVAVRDALAETMLDTVFGPVSFQSADGYENQNFPPTFVGRLVEDGAEIVWPPEYRSESRVRSPVSSVQR